MTINVIFADKKYSKLSNFGYKPFSLYLGYMNSIEVEDYNTEYSFDNVEQAFQAIKYFFCNDEYKEENENIFNSILNCNDPITCKRLGRQFKGLNIKQWNKASYSIMEELIEIAIHQNPEVKKLLKETGDETLIHNTGYKADRWTKDFPEILMRIREKLPYVITTPEIPF